MTIKFPEITTQAHAAKLIGATPSKLVYEVQCGRLVVQKIERTTLVSFEAMDAWLKRYGYRYGYQITLEREFSEAKP
jgi:hypothetical protein